MTGSKEYIVEKNAIMHVHDYHFFQALLGNRLLYHKSVFHSSGDVYEENQFL